METSSSTASTPLPREPSDYDEISMQQNGIFSDSLEDLKNLRKQLYSAADYFELSHTIDDQKQIVVDTLKEFAIKALVNTVDHLGSVTCKVNDFVDEKVGEVTGTELRVSCIEQRIRTCQEYIDHEGLSQQLLVINTPKYHKRYIVPVGETTCVANITKEKYLGHGMDPVDGGHQFRNVVRTATRETPSSKVRKVRSPSPTPRASQQPENFKLSGTIPKRELEKRAVSPRRFPHLRSASLSSRSTTPKSSRPTTPNPSRPTTPNPSIGRRQYPSQPQKSASMRFPSEGENQKDVNQIPSKGKRLLKALLTRRRSKNDELLYTYIDQYS